MTRRSNIRHSLLELRARVVTGLANRMFRNGMRQHKQTHAVPGRQASE